MPQSSRQCFCTRGTSVTRNDIEAVEEVIRRFFLSRRIKQTDYFELIGLIRSMEDEDEDEAGNRSDA